MRRSIYIILVLFIALMSSNAISQTLPVSEAQVRAELDKRGISEEELLAALLEKGIEIEDLTDLSPEQLLELEQIIIDLEGQKNAGLVALDTGVDKDSFLEEPTTLEVEKVKEDIEDFVEEISEDPVVDSPPIYGHSFFKNKDLSVFETATEVKAPANYILGSGDKIVVSIWGLSQAELALEIDSEGYVENLSRRIFLKGLSLEAAKRKLRQRFANSYRFSDGEFDVSLSYSRTINVNVQGEVENPGGYTISAINNVFNVLVAAKGPTAIGSLRDIILIKKDGNITNLDFYSYLQNPANVTNASLEEGDVIIIPIAKKLVNIRGGVKRPMIYEMKDDEKLSDLIELSGNYSAQANSEIIRVERYGNNAKSYIDVKNEEINDFRLNDGDIVNVRVYNNPAENYVMISGAVFNEGEYERVNNMLIKDLLNLSDLKNQARRDFAFIKRKLNNGKIVYLKINIEEGSGDLNIPLQNEDEINVFSQSRYFDNQRFSVSGSVRNPGSFPFALGQEINIKDAVELAGGLRRDASGYAIIHRKDPLNPKIINYTRVNLADAYSQEDEFKIGALDSLEIFSQSLFDESSTVVIKGAVNRPNTFQFGVGMTIADALTMSGGFKLSAATNRIEVSRLTIEENTPTKTVIANLQVDRDIMQNGGNLDFELAPYDEIMVRYVPEFELQKSISLVGEVRFPGDYNIIRDNETIKDVIERAGGVTDEAFPPAAQLFRSYDNLGNVILKLDEVLKNSNSRFNFSLKDGDVIEIPKSKDFVSISGATNAREMYDDKILGNQNQLNVPYHPGKDAKFYIDNYAGGIAEAGSANDIFVEKANGEINKTKNYLLYRNYPEVAKGSKIIVGYKPIKTEREKEREEVDWSKVLSDSVAQAVSVLSLLLLIQRI